MASNPNSYPEKFGAQEFKIPVKFSQEEIYESLKAEYQQRLILHGIKTDPNKIQESEW